MRKLVLLAVLSSGLIVACNASHASQRSYAPAPTATPDARSASPTATATFSEPSILPAPTVAAMAARLEDWSEPSSSGVEDTPTAILVSEVLPAAQPPQATPVRGGTTLAIPAGTAVVTGSCASDGECHWYNFYWAPTHEAVVQPGESQVKVEHELCHAHQHWSINGGAPLSPSDYDLHTWYDTPEGQSFSAASGGLSWPWSNSAINNLEDFAWTCAYWYLDPAYLLQVSPERHDWASQNLP